MTHTLNELSALDKWLDDEPHQVIFLYAPGDPTTQVIASEPVLRTLEHVSFQRTFVWHSLAVTQVELVCQRYGVERLPACLMYLNRSRQRAWEPSGTDTVSYCRSLETQLDLFLDALIRLRAREGGRATPPPSTFTQLPYVDDFPRHRHEDDAYARRYNPEEVRYMETSAVPNPQTNAESTT